MVNPAMERRTFQVDEDFTLPPLRSKRGGRLGTGPVRRVRVLATYYDTDDLRLLAAGVVLRRRSGAGGDWLLGLPTGSTEHREPATAGKDPPQALRQMVTGWIGRRPLGALLTVDTDRSAATLVDSDGRPLIEVADDRSVAERLGDGHVLRWRSLQLEALGAGEQLAEAVAARLEAAGARRAREALPLDLALAGASTSTSTSTTTGTGVGQPAGRSDPLRARLGCLTADFGEQYLLVRNEAPEAIHDFRVAARRLRSLLRTFRSLLEPEPAAALGVELRWLGEALGRVRDAEVLEARYGALLDAVPADEQLGPVRADLVGGVRQGRLAASTELADALDSERCRALVDALHDFAAAPPYLPGTDGTDRKALRRCVGHELRRVERLLDDASQAGAAERDLRLHEVRKKAKRVRYAGETLRPVAGKDARRLEKRFKAVQEVLGVRNDAVVSRRILLAEGARSGVRPGHNGYTYGLLAERERQSILEADATFPDVWEQARKAAARWG